MPGKCDTPRTVNQQRLEMRHTRAALGGTDAQTLTNCLQRHDTSSDCIGL